MSKEWWEELHAPYTAKKSIKSLVKRKREMDNAKRRVIFCFGVTLLLVVIFYVHALWLNSPTLGNDFGAYLSHFYNYKELLFMIIAVFIASRGTVYDYKKKKGKYKDLRGEVIENFLENDESLIETEHSKRYDSFAKKIEKENKIKMYHIK